MASRLPITLIGPRALPKKSLATPVLASLLVLLLAMTGCIREDDLTKEQRSHQLNGQLMCPVCDGQTIDGSNAQIAQDMRAKVRELLENGNSNAEIKDYFVVRYGEEILAAPSGGGFNYLAWIVPFFIVFGLISIALLTIRNLRRSNIAISPTPTPSMASGPSGSLPGTGGTIDPAHLAKYLEQVDRDLGIKPDATLIGIDTTDDSGETDSKAEETP